MADADRAPVAHPVESETRLFWEARRLPPASGVLGPPDGPLTRQIEGIWTPGDPPYQIVHRAVIADADARFLAISGRRASGTLRREGAAGETIDPSIGPLLARLGVWTGGREGRTWDDSDQQPGVQAIVGRLARIGLLVARDAPMRVCLSCSAPRSPERIVYQQEVGDTLLVRFPISGSDPPVHALVWVDAPWRLLGTSALLVNPDLPYVTVEYRRKEASAVLLTSQSSLDRLRSWLPDIELTVRDQTPGRELVGRTYSYPLRHEFPIGGTLAPPAGTIQAVADVGDSGTGIVPLVPGHGGTDAQIAERLGVTGWPLLTLAGVFDLTLMHKYSGLDLETANEFVERDLVEGGSVFARLRVMRGVPCCAICGNRMVWIPGRAWCLEPSHLPKEQADRYVRLLPRDRPISQIEVAPWAVSEMAVSKAPEAVTLLECTRCARLEAPDGPPKCPCGGRRHPVSRRLLPSPAGAFASWAAASGASPAESVRLYLDERRRSPALVHQLVAITGLDRPTGDVSLTLVPTVGVSRLDELLDRFGADAVRAAFVCSVGNEGGSAVFEERGRQESARLDRIQSLAREVVERCDPPLLQACAQPIEGAVRELELEDRAIIARWLYTHARIVAAHDRADPAGAHRELSQFVDRDLREYQELVRGRLALAGSPPPKRAALRTLAHLLRSLAVDLGPVAPFTSEGVHRRFVPEPRSLFEGADLSIDRALRDEALVADWTRWRAVVRAVDQFRRDLKLPASTLLPSLALVLPSEEVANRLRSEHGTLERLARVGRVEIGSPQTPWVRRTRRLVPVEREIQRAYPSMAPQIVHILHRMPPRKAGEPVGKELSVVVQGVPRAISPAMVTAVDVLPDRFVPTPFALGEMYVELPPGGPAGATAPPPLSPDAFWLVRRIRQRLRSASHSADGARRIALVVALDPLAAELAEKAAAIAEYLGLTELRVVDRTDETPPSDRISGRTRTGASWWAHLPWVASEPRAPKLRSGRGDHRRVPLPEPGRRGAADEVDYADDAVVAQGEAIRQLGEQLDELLAVPLLGPAKVAIAWEAGYRSVPSFGEEPFERLAALPGFGPPIAGALWNRLGRTPPRPASRPRPRARPPVLAPKGPASSAAVASGPTGALAMPPGTPPAAIAGSPQRRAPPYVGTAPAAPTSSTPALEPPPPPPVLPPPVGALVSAPPPSTEPSLPIPLPAGEDLDGEPSPAAPEPSETVPPSETAERILPSDVLDSSTATSEPGPGSDPMANPASDVGPVLPETVPGGELPPAVDSGPVAEDPEVPAEGLSRADEIVPGQELPESTAVDSPPERSESDSHRPEENPAGGAIDGVGSGVPPDEAIPVSEEAAGEAASAPVEVPSAERPPVPDPSPPTLDGTSEGPPEGTELRPLEPEPAGAAIEPESTTSEPAVSLSAADALPTPPMREADSERSSGPDVELPAPDSPDSHAEPPPPPVSPESEVVAEAPVPPPEIDPQEGLADVSPESRAPHASDVAPPQIPVGEPVPTPPPAETPPPEPMAAESAAASLVERGTPVEGPPAATTRPAPTEVAEAPVPIEPIPAPPTGLEVDTSESLFQALLPFLDATAAGHKGIAIVRELPERIRTHVGPRPVEVFWLSNLGRRQTLRPSDLTGIAAFVRRALVEGGVSAFFVEGAEYLILIHGIDHVVELLHGLDAEVVAGRARLWLHLTPALLPAADLERIVAEFAPGRGSSPPSPADQNDS